MTASLLPVWPLVLGLAVMLVAAVALWALLAGQSEGPGRSHHHVSEPGPTPGGGKAARPEDTPSEEGHHA